jgi:hypothetical protein
MRAQIAFGRIRVLAARLACPPLRIVGISNLTSKSHSCHGLIFADWASSIVRDGGSRFLMATAQSFEKGQLPEDPMSTSCAILLGKHSLRRS